MHKPTDTRELGDCLDIFGQQLGFDSYPHLCVCFLLASTSSDPAIISTLTVELEPLAAGLPYLAGRINNEGSGEAILGIFNIQSFGKYPL